MAYTLGEAARAVGRSKTTLGRAIKSGRISATRSQDGSYLIDPAELHRVFAVTRDGHPRMERSVTLNGPEPAPSPETLALRQLLAERESTIADLRDSIRDLRARLDSEVAERRTLIAMLVDRRPWWRRWFR
jgi:excisionase family DNA binding protein